MSPVRPSLRYSIASLWLRIGAAAVCPAVSSSFQWLSNGDEVPPSTLTTYPPIHPEPVPPLVELN